MLPLVDSTKGVDNSHIAFLDGFRGFAALIVVVSHFSNRTMGEVDVDKLLSGSAAELSFSQFFQLALGALGSGAGQVGVMIFFMLSAFLMFHLYFEKPPSRENLRNFAVGRVARIFPLYYLVVIIAVAMSILAPFDFINITLQELPAHLVFLRGNSVLWTIAPELVFYIVFMVVWSCIPRSLWLMSIFALSLILVSNLFPVVWKSYTLEFFAAGFLLYAYSRSGFRFGFHRMPIFLPPVLFIGLFSLHLPVIYRTVIGELPMHGWQTTHYVFVVLFLFVLTFESKWLRALFQSRIMAFFGDIYFSVYLLHLFVLHLLLYYDLREPDIGSLMLAMVLMIALSAAIFRLYEMPMRLLIRSTFSRKISIATSPV